MQTKLYSISGYEEAIMSLRMSKGKYFSIPKAEEIQSLVWLVTDRKGFICSPVEYYRKLDSMEEEELGKITGYYEKDLAEFERLLGLVLDNAMGKHKHHTLMKYIDISFFSEGLHRGAQDDLDSHAIAFNNRITRFSTRLAEIKDVEVSEWYQDKIIPFAEAFNLMDMVEDIPEMLERDGQTYHLTPFGYVIDKHSQVPAKNGLSKDVQRGLMHLALPSNAIWKSDLFNLRYVYKMRSKFTKANPELKDAMELLADQIEEHVPVFGDYFRKELTDSGTWEHMSKIKTISHEEFQEFKKWRKQMEERNEG